jgi:hypothetical protein
MCSEAFGRMAACNTIVDLLNTKWNKEMIVATQAYGGPCFDQHLKAAYSVCIWLCHDCQHSPSRARPLACYRTVSSSGAICFSCTYNFSTRDAFRLCIR